MNAYTVRITHKGTHFNVLVYRERNPVSPGSRRYVVAGRYNVLTSDEAIAVARQYQAQFGVKS